MGKFEILDNKVILPVNSPQAAIRIADEGGNHVSKPTQAKNESKYFAEWMIT